MFEIYEEVEVEEDEADAEVMDAEVMDVVVVAVAATVVMVFINQKGLPLHSLLYLLNLTHNCISWTLLL